MDINNSSLLKYFPDCIFSDGNTCNISTGNNTYDLIGNLISDNAEGINNITWNVYGKISSIDKVSGPDLTFAYDPMGNRIMKLVDDGSALIYTYYVRDAQGNVLSTYSRIDDASDDIITLSELHIYGSSRLGIMVEDLDMSTTITSDGHSQRNLGKKRYELNNHLGNVLTVISDRRFGTEQGTTGLIKYYEGDVLQAQDYYPFGMLTPGRNWSAGSEYRFGFGGQEKDDEVYGNGNLNTAMFWEYDTRLGRRWNVDPLFKKYTSLSPYSTYGNNPVVWNDPTGLGGDLDVRTDKDGNTSASVTMEIYIYSDDPNVNLVSMQTNLQTSLTKAYNQGDLTLQVLKPHKDVNGNKVQKGMEGKVGGQVVNAPVEFNFNVQIIQGGSDVALSIVNNNQENSNNYYMINNGPDGSIAAGYNYTSGNSGILNANANPKVWSHEIGHNLGYWGEDIGWLGHNISDPTDMMFQPNEQCGYGCWVEKAQITSDDIYRLNGMDPQKNFNKTEIGANMDNSVYTTDPTKRPTKNIFDPINK